jgi:inorganic pyrophosphatase
MLGTMSMGLTIDAYGPISDNAGGLAEMAFHDVVTAVRTRTDCLDAAGNTTAAIGKGFAIGSAALVSLALFGAFTVRANIENVDILDPWVFTGLILGAMLPYGFAACTMRSVGKAADEMYQECERQIPVIIAKKEAKKIGATPMKWPEDAETKKLWESYPDYDRCILMSSKASIMEMILPGAMVILSPLVAGLGFGKNTCAGMLSGALVSSVQLAISMSNSGGAWDNAKKYIKARGDGSDDHDKRLDSGKQTHENAVTGDTVGDPLKDTSGPALNIVMKLTAILSLVFGTAIAEYSNANGGPVWLAVQSSNATATV